jgi:hypothetical protein
MIDALRSWVFFHRDVWRGCPDMKVALFLPPSTLAQINAGFFVMLNGALC